MSSCFVQENDYITVQDRKYTFGDLSFTQIKQNSLWMVQKSGRTSNNHILSCCLANNILSKAGSSADLLVPACSPYNLFWLDSQVRKTIMNKFQFYKMYQKIIITGGC